MTKERQFRLRKAANDRCVHCDLVESHTHHLSCVTNTPVTQPLLTLFKSYMPDVSREQLICLDWEEVEDTAAELPLLIIFTICLSYTWDRRKEHKEIRYRECRADLFAHLSSLKRTKLNNEAIVLEELLKNYFK